MKKIINFLTPATVLVLLFFFIVPANASHSVMTQKEVVTIGNYSGSLAEVISTIGTAEKLLVINKSTTVSTDSIIPSNVALWITKGGRITIGAGKTLTVKGPFEAGQYQVFGGTGSVIFGSGSIEKVPVQWFGAVGDGVADDSDALAAAVTSVEAIHGVVFIPSGSTLRVTKTIPMGGISLIGAHRDASRIFADYDGTVLSADPDSLSHFVMKNITLTGEITFTWTLTSATNQIGLLLKSAHKSIIENCYFVHLDTAIKIIDGSYYNVLAYNLFRTNKLSIYLLASTPLADAPNEINIIFNQFDIWPSSQGGPGRTIGIKLHGVTTAALSAPKIIGNGFENIHTGIQIINSHNGLYLHNRFEDVAVYITGDVNTFNNLLLGGNMTNLSKISFARPNWNLIIAPFYPGKHKGYPLSLGANGHLALGYMEYVDNLKETAGLGLVIGNEVIEFLNATVGNGYGYKIDARKTGAGGLKLFELGYRNNSASWTTALNINQYGRVSIGTTEAAKSCVLDINSTTEAIRIPRLTTAQRDAIPAPLKGMLIYNTSVDKYQGYTTTWVDLH